MDKNCEHHFQNKPTNYILKIKKLNKVASPSSTLLQPFMVGFCLMYNL